MQLAQKSRKTSRRTFLAVGGSAALLLLVAAIALSQGEKTFTVQGAPRGAPNQKASSSLWNKAKSLVGLGSADGGEEGITNQAAQGIFLDKKSSFFQERAREVTNYLINASNLIAINPAALRFAIGQAVLGRYDELDDAQKRMEDARTSIQALALPSEASVFHALSLDLLESYRRILKKIRITSRKDVNQSTFADDLAAIKKTAALARQEARFLVNQFDIPYAPPRVILLYDEAIGL